MKERSGNGPWKANKHRKNKERGNCMDRVNCTGCDNEFGKDECLVDDISGECYCNFCRGALHKCPDCGRIAMILITDWLPVVNWRSLVGEHPIILQWFLAATGQK